MLRYYQMALKELEKSSDKQEAMGEVEEPHHEQVVNGQTSVNNKKRKKSDEQESSDTHVKKKDGELKIKKKKKKRKKSKEDWTVVEAVTRHDNVDANKVTKREKKKKKKKKKKTRLEIDSDAGNSNDRDSFSSQFNESRIDPPFEPKDKKIKRKRKRECLTEFSERTVIKQGKHSAETTKSHKRRDGEARDEKQESNFSCSGRIENIHTLNSMESSSLIQTTNTSNFEISPRSSPQSSSHVSKKSSQSVKESTNESQKLKTRKKRIKGLKLTKAAGKENILNGNNNETEVKRVKPTLTMDEAKLREAVKISNIIHETWTLSKERLQALAEEGIRVKKGKWSNLEHDLLKFNMARFLERHDLSDPYPLLFRSSMDAMERKNWKRFAHDNEFYKELGKGIQRELFSIYKCATRIFDETNYVGKYTEDEIKELRRLHSIHGSDWVTIGQLMDRSRMSVNRKLSKLHVSPKGDELKQEGKWTDDELKQLYEAVHFVTNTAEGESVFHGIDWQGVAQMVKTRSANACREKWLNKLCWSMSENNTQSKWSKGHELKLITRLYNSGVTEECDVDWMDVKSEYDIDYSPQWLRLKWATVKKNVPNYQRLSFEDIVNYLYRVYGQTLRDNLQ